ncbi:MAG TPA: VWA domain-containing protein [Pyrinomonadaceae bacterium]|jgi:VWFA-related protein
MRKFVGLLLLLSLLCPVALRGQTRARRVPQPDNSNTPANPAPASAPRRDHPPVLGGAPVSNERTSGQRQTQPDGPVEVDENEVVRVNTTLVTIPVSVMDRDGKYVPSIRQDEFRIFEDGVEQQLAYFAAVEKPFTVALVLDNSTSTKFKTEEMQDAAIAFVDQLRADDRVMIVAFDTDVHVLAEPTSDRRALRAAIRRTRNEGNTSLYDAVDFVIHQRFNHIDGRKAIVLFTDGVDTSSRRASYESNVSDAEELDALIYPIAYDTYNDANSGRTTSGGGNSSPSISLPDILGTIIFGGGGRRNNRRGGGGGGGGGTWPPAGGGGGGTCSGCSPAEYERADHYLHDMARVTGGRLYRADTTRNLAQSFALIAEELRRQYSLGYYPKTPAQVGQRRHIRVRVMRPDLVVQARDSYIFNPNGPTQQADTNGQRNKPVLQGRPFSAP